MFLDWLLQAGGLLRIDDTGTPLNSSVNGRVALNQHVRHGLIDRTMPPQGSRAAGRHGDLYCARPAAYQQLRASDLAICESTAPDVFKNLLPGEPLMGPVQRGMHLHFEKSMAWSLTDSPDATFEAMKYFSGSLPARDIYFRIASLPCRRTMESYALFEREPHKSMARNMRFGQSHHMVPQDSLIKSAISKRVLQAALGNVTVREALDGMDADIAQITAGNRPTASS